MLNIVALFLLFGITLGTYAPYYDLENADQYFNEFIQKYEKNYENAKEHRMRFEIFKNKLKKYNEWNDYYQHEKGGHVITWFADQEGYQSCINLSQMRNTTSYIQVKKEFLKNLPDHVDYREQNLVTGVKDQKYCGSCYAFAAIANIESMYAKKTGHLLPLSEQQPLDCIKGNCARGGDPLDVPTGLAEQGGSETEDEYPYEALKKTCRTDKTKIKVKVIEGHEIPTPDVESLKAALVQNGAPLAITLYATDAMSSALGFVILNPDDCHNEDANHAVLLVGYNTDAASGKTYWIIKNSWGTTHGDKGYYYLDVNSKCSVGKTRTITSTVETVL